MAQVRKEYKVVNVVKVGMIEVFFCRFSIFLAADFFCFQVTLQKIETHVITEKVGRVRLLTWRRYSKYIYIYNYISGGWKSGVFLQQCVGVTHAKLPEFLVWRILRREIFSQVKFISSRFSGEQMAAFTCMLLLQEFQSFLGLSAIWF